MAPESSDVNLQAWCDALAADWQSVPRSHEWFEGTPARVAQIARQLGVSKPAPHVFAVAGTNGKGSTCMAVAEIATAQGLSVGVLTSPHLHRFNERIRINGELASDADIVSAFEHIRSSADVVGLSTVGPSQFDYFTLAAAWLFHRERVDVAVMEVGLGGRLDPVNGFEPDVSIITRVALDHAQWLGSDREAIGREKAGIQRPGVPCIVGEPSPPKSVVDYARNLGTPLAIRGQEFDDQCIGLGRDGHTLTLPTLSQEPGRLPRDSLITAARAWWARGLSITQETLDEVSSTVGLTGRCQLLRRQDRDIVLDIAHNPDAVTFLGEEVRRWTLEMASSRVLGLFAAQLDKDVDGMLIAAKPWIDKMFICTTGETGHSTAFMAGLPVCQGGWVEGRYDKVSTASGALMAMSQPNDLIVVFGSVSLVAQTLNELVPD
ncbi:MAG: Mur ligase family protein [Pseudomonadota bacterium]